jgi:hypothetical protein
MMILGMPSTVDREKAGVYPEILIFSRQKSALADKISLFPELP